MQRLFDKRIVFVMTLIVVVLVADAFFSHFHIRQLNGRTGWVVHTYQVLRTLDETKIALLTAQNAQRDYVITGDADYVDSYNAAAAAVGRRIEELKLLTQDNASQQTRIADFQTLVAGRLQQMNGVMDLAKKDLASAREAIAAGKGKQTMGAIDKQASAIQQEELRLLEIRERQSGRSYGIAVYSNLFMTMLSLALIAAFIYLLRQSLAERAKTAATIHEQREWFSTTLASIGDAVLTTDTDGRVKFLNAVAQSLTGWTQEEAHGVDSNIVFNIVNEKTRRQVESPVTKALREKRIVGLANHTVLLAKDGSERPIDDSASIIRDEKGSVTGVVMVFRDVREHRQSENERKRYMEQLAQASRRKDEFLATLAHELRNPLAPIRNALTIMDMANDRETLQKARHIIGRQVEQMVHLVDDLMDASRIAHNKIDLRKEPVLLSTVIDSAVEIVKPLIEEQKHTLVSKMLDEPIWINGDLTRLAQLFSNLLSNAVKYSEPGGRIDLFVEKRDNAVVIRVRDQGVGMASSVLSSIFEMFSQADSSLGRSRGGLGIGLSLAKNIAELHGGTIEAHSEGVGKGSEFAVRLPVIEGGSDRKPVSLSDKPRKEKSSSYRVLVVDDNEESAQTLGMMLEMMGHEICVVFDGKRAIEAARDFAPHVVLLDIGLPDLNGYEVCKTLRQNPAFARTVIAAQTGWGQEEHKRLSRESGFDYHLVKPILMSSLEEIFVSLEQEPKAKTG